jgi:hypothetical protein
MISCLSLYNLAKGKIYETLQRIYYNYVKIDQDLYIKWEKNWREYDDLVFQYPDTVGKAGFSTFMDDKYAEFCSWDPRQAPERVIIGHNGILPEFRRKNLGTEQVKEML